jgi:hypothetical protein
MYCLGLRVSQFLSTVHACCSAVRNQAVESVYVILTKICIGPRKSEALQETIKLLFDNMAETKNRADLAGNYFHLLCRYVPTNFLV